MQNEKMNAGIFYCALLAALPVICLAGERGRPYA